MSLRVSICNIIAFYLLDTWYFLPIELDPVDTANDKYHSI